MAMAIFVIINYAQELLSECNFFAQLGDEGVLLHIDLSNGKRRLGGSALAQVYDQVIMVENPVLHCSRKHHFYY